MFEVVTHWAVRANELSSLLLLHKPDIVHFSGHGYPSSELVFEDNSGNSHTVSPDALSQLFSLLKENIHCVVLNACYTEEMAEAIAQHIDCVIGMSQVIGDTAAISFVAAFYLALGYGRDVKTAFDLGRVQINLENLDEQDRPILVAPNQDPSDIVFVKYSASELAPYVQRMTQSVETSIPYPPFPSVDPSFLQTLPVPGGAFNDDLYIARDADTKLEKQLLGGGTTTTIRAPRQTGKTSLLMRGLQYARQQAAVVVPFDLQSSSSQTLSSLENFLQEFAAIICDELVIEETQLAQCWQGTLSAPRKLLRFMQQHILPMYEGPIILAIDEADHLLESDFYKDFFGMLRSWHNRRALDPLWQKLNIVLVISTEPYLLVDDIHHSPFNVGLHLSLDDFDEAQVRELNTKHQFPLSDAEISDFMMWINGHPYLTRWALYTMLEEHKPWAKLINEAIKDDGPFSRHLNYQYWSVQDKPALIKALVEVLHNGNCQDELARFRLLKAGLIKGSGKQYTCRCKLYQRYFEKRLLY